MVALVGAGVVVLLVLNRWDLQRRSEVQSTVAELREHALTGRSAVRTPPSEADKGANVALRAPTAAAATASSESTNEAPPPRESAQRVLAGRVVDATRPGEPISNAAVLLNDPIAPLAEAQTGVDGSFRLVVDQDAIDNVIVRAAGFRFTRWHSAELEALSRDAAGILDFPVFPGASLRGRVVDNHGEPLSDGRLIAFDEAMWNRIYSPRLARKRKLPVEELEPMREYDLFSSRLYKAGRLDWQCTNHPFAWIAEDGTFALTDLAANVPLYLYVDADRATRAFHRILLELGEDREATVTVQRAPLIHGRARIPEVDGLTNPGVWFCVHGEHDGIVSGADRWVPLQPGGAFSSGPLWPAEKVGVTFTYEVTDPAHGLRYYEKRVEVSLGEEEVLQLQVDLDDAYQVPWIPERVR